MFIFMSKNRMLSVLLLITFLGICLALAMPALAGPKVIKGEWKTPQGYPFGFNGYGQLYDINTDGVIIDDVKIMLSPNVTYHTPTSTFTSASAIKAGDIVGYLKDGLGRITSLWKIPED